MIKYVSYFKSLNNLINFSLFKYIYKLIKLK